MNKFFFVVAGCIVALGVRAAVYYPITVDYDPGYASGEAAVTDFPVLLRIRKNLIFAAAGENGKNLRFTDDFGIVAYPHEVDTWDTNGVSLVWVKLPSLRKGTVFRLYCEGQDPTQKTNTWSAYAGVWHLNEALDSTGKDLDVDGVTHTTRLGAPPAHRVENAPIGFGYGQSAAGVGPSFVSKVYDSRRGYEKPMQVTNPSEFSVSCWVRVRDPATAWKALFGPVSSDFPGAGWAAQFSADSACSVRLFQGRDSSPNALMLNTVDEYGASLFSRWTKVDGIWNGKRVSFHINGRLLGETEFSGEPGWFWSGWMGWGGYAGSDGLPQHEDSSVGAEFDECRIYDGVASPKRIAADYATVVDESFLSMGNACGDTTIPEGTVARVGSACFQNLSWAVTASAEEGLPVILMVDGLSLTLKSPKDRVSVKLCGFSFRVDNGVNGYFLNTQYDPESEVTTYSLRKQTEVAAMRNVAVYKELHTRDLAELLPAKVAGLSAGGKIVGMYDVEWDVEDISKYDKPGITQVPGLAKVGGIDVPVTAFVRAALPYAEGLHNIAPEASSMTVSAPSNGLHEAIFDVTRISSDSPAGITNGLPATAAPGKWASSDGSMFTNWESGKLNPCVDVDFSWKEPKPVYRIEVFVRINVFNRQPENIGISTLVSTNVVKIAEALPVPNPSHRPWIGNYYNYCYEFPDPLEVRNLKVSMQGPEETYLSILEILVWSDGEPIDRCEMSKSADLLMLEVDGSPLEGFDPRLRSYRMPRIEGITAWAGDPNVGATILPESEGIIRVITMAEDGVTTKTYLVQRRGGFFMFLR